MKKILYTTSRLGFVFLVGAALSLSSCSTGTKEGDVSVEQDSAKDKDPEERTVRQEDPAAAAAADSAANADDPDANKTYQKVDPDNGARDTDNDGKVD